MTSSGQRHKAPWYHARQRHKARRPAQLFDFEICSRVPMEFCLVPHGTIHVVKCGTRTTRPAAATTLLHFMLSNPVQIVLACLAARSAQTSRPHSQSVLSICKPSLKRLRSQRSAADALVVADTTFCGFGNDTSTASTNCTDNSWRGLRLLHDDASGGSGSSGGCWCVPPPKPGLRFDLSPRRSGQRRGCWSSNPARHVLAAVQSVQ